MWSSRVEEKAAINEMKKITKGLSSLGESFGGQHIVIVQIMKQWSDEDKADEGATKNEDDRLIWRLLAVD